MINQTLVEQMKPRPVKWRLLAWRLTIISLLPYAALVLAALATWVEGCDSKEFSVVTCSGVDLSFVFHIAIMIFLGGMVLYYPIVALSVLVGLIGTLLYVRSTAQERLQDPLWKRPFHWTLLAGLTLAALPYVSELFPELLSR